MPRLTLLKGLLAAAAIGVCLPSVAAGVVLPTTQASELIFDFNFTGKHPAAPYSFMELEFDTSVTGSRASTLDYVIFSGLDGTGTKLYSGTETVSKSANTTETTGLFSFAGMTDGIFSIGVYAPKGDVKLLSVFADGLDSRCDPMVEVQGVKGTVAAVPEPSSYALALAGFAALGFAAKRGRRTAQTA